MIAPLIKNAVLVHPQCTLNKKSLNEWGYSLATVLQSKVFVQWLNFQSMNEDITCSVTEFSLIDQGLYFAAPWAKNLLIHSMILFWEWGLSFCLKHECLSPEVYKFTTYKDILSGTGMGRNSPSSLRRCHHKFIGKKVFFCLSLYLIFIFQFKVLNLLINLKQASLGSMG